MAGSLERPMGSKKAKLSKKEGAGTSITAASSIAGLGQVFSSINRGNLQIKRGEEITSRARMWLELGDKEKAKEVILLHDVIEREEACEREGDKKVQHEQAELEKGEDQDRVSRMDSFNLDLEGLAPTPLRSLQNTAENTANNAVVGLLENTVDNATSSDDSIGDIKVASV
jgi:hypothetical protein